MSRLRATSGVTAALITGVGQLEYRTFPAAPPGPGAVTVSLTLSGICGTEVASFRHGRLHSPAVCGHEWTGLVTAAGAGVRDRKEGDRVVVGVRPACGACTECAAGLAERCRAALRMARGKDPLAPPHGGFARSITVDAARVLPAHAGLSDVEAAQVEPASVAFHGLRRSGLTAGDTVLVQGAGPIGLLTAQLARACGAASVIVVEPAPTRQALARRLGADVVLAPGDGARQQVLELTRGLGADVVFECAGGPDLLQSAVELVRARGTVVLLSYLDEPARIDAAAWMAKEVQVRGALAFTHEDVRRTMALLADGRVRAAPLHTRTIGLDQLGSALDRLATGGSDDVKVLVDLRAGA